LKRSKRWVLGFVVVLVAAVVWAAWFVRRPWPKVEGTLAVDGLEAPVEVVRDQWGTAHLYAESSRDLFFAQGFVQAQDRMWQMELFRRAASGRLAAAVGSGGVAVDRATLVIGLRRAAQREWEVMEGEPREILLSFAAGVNAYLEQHRGRLAMEFQVLRVEPEAWKPVDSLLAIKLLYWQLSENATFEWARARYLGRIDEETIAEILPPYSEGAPIIVPTEAAGFQNLAGAQQDHLGELSTILGTPGPGQGSNGWVLSPERTANGAPLLANDTHLDLFQPSPWYAMGLHGGGFDTVGYSLAGTPLLVIGHNQDVAWGLTDLVPDVEYLYQEKLDDPDNPTRYLFEGEWRDLGVQEEIIKVRGEADIPLKILSTHHGNLLGALGGALAEAEPMALAWPGHEGETLIASMAAINRSRGWVEFRAGAALWDGPHVSFLYADQEGNIGYQAAGRVPLRVEGHQGAVPVPGWTGEYDWQGSIPFEELPYAFNPKKGFVVAANQKAVDDNYPYQMGYEWADPYRALRITEVLEELGQGATADDMRVLQGDTFHLPARVLRPFLLQVTAGSDLERRALEEVAAWNLRLDPEEVGPSIYQVWYRNLVRNLLEDELGEELAEEYLEYYWVHGPVMVRLMEEGTSSLIDDTRTPEVETREALAQRSFEEAIGWLEERLGGSPETWKWGRLHTLTFIHRPIGMAEIPIISRLFNGGSFPSPAGDRFTVNAGWFSIRDEEAPFGNDGGATARMVLDLSDWDRARAVNSTGQSEHLFHPHRGDLTDLWRQGKLHPLPYSRPAVDAARATVLRLEPRDEESHG